MNKLPLYWRAWLCAWGLAVPFTVQAAQSALLSKVELELVTQKGKSSAKNATVKPSQSVKPRPSALDAQSFSDLFLSSVLLQRGQIPQGFALMQRAAMRTQDPELLKQIVRIAIGIERPELGREALRTLARQASQDTEVIQFALGLMHPSQPEFETLVKNYLERTAASPLRVEFAQRLIAQKRMLEAQAQLQTAVKLAPKDVKAWFLLGASYLEQRHLEAAQHAYETVLSLVGKQALTHNGGSGGLAQPVGVDGEEPSSVGQQSSQAALNQVQSLLEVQAKSRQEQLYLQEARAQLLHIYAKTKQMRQAEALLAQLPRSSPEALEAAQDLEVAYWSDTGQWQRVFDALEASNKRALEAKSPDSNRLYSQAIAAEKIGRVAEMERLLTLIMELDPKHYNALNALGYSWVERGVRLNEARVLIERALKLSPQSGYIWDSLGWLEFKTGNVQKAVEILEKAYQLQADPEIAAHWGEALWVSGQKDEARKVWQQGLKLDKAHEVLSRTIQRLDPSSLQTAKP